MKGYWKRTTALALCLSVALCLGACRKEKEPVKTTGPSKVVAEALDAAQEGDFGTVVDVLDPDSGERTFMLRPDMVQQASGLMLGCGIIQNPVTINDLSR